MQCRGVGVGPQLGAERGIAHRARHHGERLEMFDPGVERCEQRENKVDGLTIDRIAIP